MTKNELIELSLIRMIAYYDFKGEMPGGGIHPRVTDLKLFLQNNINTGPELHEFLKRIKDNCEYFPKHTDLHALYNNMKTLAQQDTGINLLEFSENENISQEPDELNKAATVEDVIKSDKTMSSKSLLKMYGLKLCHEAWFKIGQEMSDDKYDRFIANVRQRNFDAAFKNI